MQRCNYCNEYVLWVEIVGEDRRVSLDLSATSTGLYIVVAGNNAIECDEETAARYAARGARRYRSHLSHCKGQPLPQTRRRRRDHDDDERAIA